MIENNAILYHSIKAIEYRFSKAIACSKDDFGEFRISDHTRRPGEIINHMFDLVLKTKTKILEGHFNIQAPEPVDFNTECNRFMSGLENLRFILANTEIDIETSKRLLQGPILDIATHIGQIAMLNGLNGNRIIKESYYSVELG